MILCQQVHHRTVEDCIPPLPAAVPCGKREGGGGGSSATMQGVCVCVCVCVSV
jgi:hypothetical protein